MGIAADTLMQVQAQLCDRIDRIAVEMPHLSVARLATEVDDVRRIAANNGLGLVVEIARRMESALAASDGGMMAMSFLETMRDAVGCDRTDPATTQTYLAAINQRFYG